MSVGAGEKTGGVFAVAAVVGLGALALNTMLPAEDSEQESEGQAGRLAAMHTLRVGTFEDDEDESEKDTVLATARSSRKRL